MTNAERRIAAIATGQLGAFSRRQAFDAGLSAHQLRSRVQSGFLLQTGPNSFRVAGAPPTIESGLRGLLLDVGEPAWVAGPTAAALHGFEGFSLRRPFHILLPAERNVRRGGVVIHRSEHTAAVDVTTVRGWATTSGTRTVIDLARLASPEQLSIAVESALLTGSASENSLYRRIAKLRSQGRFGLPALLDVLDRRAIAGGTDSWLEREYLRIIATAGLPRPLTQQVLTRAGDRTVRVDCHFAGTNLVVELLGYRYHRSRDALTRDARRLNALIADGFTPYQFTYDQVVNEPSDVVVTTHQALRRAIAAA